MTNASIKKIKKILETTFQIQKTTHYMQNSLKRPTLVKRIKSLKEKSEVSLHVVNRSRDLLENVLLRIVALSITRLSIVYIRRITIP